MKRRNFLAESYRREYQKKRFQNPTQPRRRIPWRAVLMFFVLSIAVVSIPFVLSYAPAFAFETMTVEGLTNIPQQDVLDIVHDQANKKRYRLFPSNNKFFFNEEAAVQRLQDTFDFATLQIIVEGRQIHVKAEERINELVWAVQDAYFFLDLNGAIVGELSEPEKQQAVARLTSAAEPAFEEPVRKLPPHMPIIQDKKSSVVTKDDQMVEPSFVQSILTIDEQLREINVTPVSYAVSNLPPEYIEVHTQSGYDLFLTENDVDNQISNLQILLQDYQERLQEISYIDLRFGNHVYIK